MVLAGDFNVAPTEIDIYPTTSWDDDALVQPESRAAYARLVKQGWTDAIRASSSREERVYTFWHYMRNRWQRECRPSSRSSPSQSGHGDQTQEGGRGSNDTREGRGERSRAGVDPDRIDAFMLQGGDTIDERDGCILRQFGARRAN